MSDETDAVVTDDEGGEPAPDEAAKAGLSMPDWADTVVKIPLIPADGPMPTEATASPKSKTGSKPTLPPPPPVHKSSTGTRPKPKAPHVVAPPPLTPQLAEPAVASSATASEAVSDSAASTKTASSKASAVKEPSTPDGKATAQTSDTSDKEETVAVPLVEHDADSTKPKAAEHETTLAERNAAEPEGTVFPPDDSVFRQPTAFMPAQPTAVVQVASEPAVTVAPVKKKGDSKHRRARLRVSHIDPWSMMKTSFLFSIAFGIIVFVVVYMLWMVLSTSGLFDSLNQFVASVFSNPDDANAWQIQDYLSTNKVLGVTALLAAINVVILTALGTLGAFLYNLGATAVGGIEVTLAED